MFDRYDFLPAVVFAAAERSLHLIYLNAIEEKS